MDPRPVRDIFQTLQKKKTGRSLKIAFSKRGTLFVKKKTKLKCLSIRSEQFCSDRQTFRRSENLPKK